jgi:hypothetical protein
MAKFLEAMELMNTPPMSSDSRSLSVRWPAQHTLLSRTDAGGCAACVQGLAGFHLHIQQMLYLPYVLWATDNFSLRIYNTSRPSHCDSRARKGNVSMNTDSMQIILGLATLKAYVTAPKSFKVLGIVRFGQEYGLLATDTQGLYFRVNGSQVVALDSICVHRALDYAYGNQGQLLHGLPNARRLHTPIPVLVRKHRHVAAVAAH